MSERPENAGRRSGDIHDAARLREQAVAWLALLSSGEARQSDGEALKRWCREDPAHAAAYAKAARTWTMLQPVATHAAQADAMPAGPMLARRAFLGGAIAASVTGGAYVAVRPPLGLWPSLAELAADVRTTTGEQRRIDLAEGVAVELNTRSSLSLRDAAEGGRHIELISGEAIVAAGAAARNACVVTAGQGRILAIDTKVDIRHDHGGRVRIVCLDGRVDVEHQAQTLLLKAGQQVAYGPSGIGLVEVADPLVVSAWQRGRLIFRREPLAQVIAEVNRYRSGRIVLTDDKLGQRLIDASFQLSRLDNVIVYIEQAFDARIRRLPGSIVLVG